MRKFLTGGAAALALALAPAALADTTTVGVSVTFARALLITGNAGVNFGSANINGNAGTLNMNVSNGVITRSGGVTAHDASTAQRGFVEFFAPRPGNVGITIPTTVTLSNQFVSGQNVIYTPASDVTSVVVSRYSEIARVYFGGTVSFNLDTYEGLYTGQFQVEIDYN